MEKPESRFRLRWNEKIIGYAKQIHRTIFYSPDQYAWSGKELEYNLKDSFTGLFDINRRPIYTEDIIEFRDNPEHTYAFILLDEVLQQFQLLSIDGEELISNDAVTYLKNMRYVWKSYRFIQNHL